MTTRALDGIGSADVAREHERQDELLTRLEDENRVPPVAWSAMLETLSRLRDLPDACAWVATRYLQACMVRGHQMFPDVEQQSLGIPTSHEVASMPCPCGGTAPVDHRRSWRGAKVVEVGACGDCRTVLARWDGEGYTKPTLYAPGFT